MGYCIDDICHNSSPMCGAGSPEHCRADGGPDIHECRDPNCPECEPWNDDDDEWPDDFGYRGGADDGGTDPA